MSYQPKSYRKFLAGAVTTALVASAVAPVAGAEAADFSFTDDAELGSHKDNIYKAVEAGFINGYPNEDGSKTFKPYQDITRGQVVKILANTLGDDVDTSGVENFKDLEGHGDSELIEAALKVRAADIFSGTEDGNLLPANKITRQQMAKVLVKAFDLESKPGEGVDVKDLDAAFDDFKEYIQVVAQNEVTNQENFNPLQNVTRAQFATFVVRAMGEEEAPVEDPVVEGVKAITPTEAQVTLNVDLEEISKDDLVVTNQDGEKQYVKSVEIVKPQVRTFAATKSTQLKVEFYNPLKSGDKYTFAVKVGEETVSSTIDFEIGVAETIELSDQFVKPEGNVIYKVLDENGLDITSLVTVNVETNSSGFFETAKKGNLKLTKGAIDSAFLKLAVKNDAGKTIAESKRVTITADISKPVNLAGYWTLADEKNIFNVEAYEKNKDKNPIVQVVNMGTTDKHINVSVTDQFDEDFETANAKNLKFKSLDTDIAVVDETSGKVTPRSEGTVPVKITYTEGDVELTATIELEVVAKAKFADFKLDKENVSLNNKVEDLKTAKVEVEKLDQFGNKLLGDTKEVKAESSDKKVATVKVNGNKVEITAEGEGTATVTVTVGDIEKEISVTVKEPGEVADYVVEGFKNVLLFDNEQEADADEDDTEMVLKVKSIDADGVPTDILDIDKDEYSIVVTDADGEVVSGDNDYGLSIEENKISIAKNSVNLEKDYEGPFTVTVKVGSDDSALTVFESEFTVKDNRVAPEFSITDNNLVITSSITEINNFVNLIGEKFEFDVDTEETVSVTAVEYVSLNEAVITSSKADEYSVNDGKTTIQVDTITVEVNSEDTFKLDLNGEVFNVTVDTTAPEVKVTAPENIKQDDEKITITFNVKDLSDISFLEIDHSLGKHGNETQIPGMDGVLVPEFKLYTNNHGNALIDPERGANPAQREMLELMKIEATYIKNGDTHTWVLTMSASEGSSFLDLVKKESGETFDLYYLAQDIHGHSSGDMNKVNEDMTKTINISQE